MKDYPFEIRPLTTEEGGGYFISYPDFDMCVSDGETIEEAIINGKDCLLYTSPSPRDRTRSRMPSSA